MEVCMDDMLVKSFKANQHLGHLQQIFQVLKEYNMKLNLSRYSFGVTAGKSLE